MTNRKSQEIFLSSMLDKSILELQKMFKGYPAFSFGLERDKTTGRYYFTMIHEKPGEEQKEILND